MQAARAPELGISASTSIGGVSRNYNRATSRVEVEGEFTMPKSSPAGRAESRPSRNRGLRLPPSLWEHQRAAVETIQAYLNASDPGDRAALITMPTGTGKTGVIAATVMLLHSVVGHRLVLSPWDALADQLIDDLRGRFWSRLPAEQRPGLPPVKRLPSSSDVARIGQASEPTVFVATIAAISVLARRAAELGYEPRQDLRLAHRRSRLPPPCEDLPSGVA
jgi:hypothetical protein